MDKSHQLEVGEYAAAIRVAIDGAGGVAEVSRRSGLPIRTLHNYRAGLSSPNAANLVKIASAVGRSVDQILGVGVIASASGESSDLGEFVTIPKLSIRASAGPGLAASPSDLETTGKIAFQRSWLRQLGVDPDYAHFLQVDGDSMAPTLQNGDWVLINRKLDRIVANAIYVIVYGGAVMVKRVNILWEGTVQLISDNERYGVETISADRKHELQVEGRVVWFSRVL